MKYIQYEYESYNIQVPSKSLKIIEILMQLIRNIDNFRTNAYFLFHMKASINTRKRFGICPAQRK